jgi:prepilin-type processing-associated H-X9-DG protein
MPWGVYPFNPLYSKCLNTGDGASNPWYKLGTTTIIDNIPNNVWHHFVVTGNGSVNYLYVDGVKYG